MDYAEALVEIQKNIRLYRNAVLKNNTEKARESMTMIQQYVDGLEIATQQMEKENAKRVTITFR